MGFWFFLHDILTPHCCSTLGSKNFKPLDPNACIVRVYFIDMTAVVAFFKEGATALGFVLCSYDKGMKSDFGRFWSHDCSDLISDR